MTAFLGYVLPWGCSYGPTWLNWPINFTFVNITPLVALVEPDRKTELFHNSTAVSSKAGPQAPGFQRIGPHNLDVISVLIGNMLGDGWAENRSHNTRFHIHMGSPNVEYLMWLHNFFSERGYCSSKKPQLKRNINKGNKIYFSYKFRTWTYSSLNWIYHSFYNQNKVKIVPFNIQELLTPLTLAIWVMDDGGVHPSGLIFSTYCFDIDGVTLLQKALKNKFDIETTIQSRKAGLIIYLPKNQLPKLSKSIRDLMIPSMYYKLNGY